MATRPADPFRLDDELRVLRALAGGPLSFGEIRRAVAARMIGNRPARAVERLRAADEVVLEDSRYQLTDAGKARLRPAPRLPVVPAAITPHVGFHCPRIGTHVTATQCVLRHRTADDGPCARGIDGELVAGGCPFGADVARRLEAYEEETRLARRGQKARAA